MKTRHIIYAGVTVMLFVALIMGSFQYQANAQCPPVNTPMSSPMMSPMMTPNRVTGATLSNLQNPQVMNMNIMDALNSLGQYSSFVSAMRNAGLENRLSTGSNLTVFVPTNQAFGMLPQIPWSQLQQAQNRNRLSRIMNYHIVQGPINFTGADLSNRLRFRTMEGDDVIIRQAEGMYFVENSQIMAAYRTNNGTIYVIDTVMIPGNARVEFLSTEKVKSPTDVELKNNPNAPQMQENNTNINNNNMNNNNMQH